eukprot:scaffold10.g2308.t1
MTYAHCVITPGPRLNLVLGPNGTGKSSLVCGLCVGLAGGTRLLGRADDVSSYVRQGTQSGWVEITLSSGDPQRLIVIRRTLRADNNSSEWRMNGREVVEFARLKPVALLAATEKAIGNAELFEQHEELTRLREELGRTQSAHAAIAGQLERLRSENQRNENAVKQVRQRRALLEAAEAMERKLPWLVYAKAKAELDEAKQAGAGLVGKGAPLGERACRLAAGGGGGGQWPRACGPPAHLGQLRVNPPWASLLVTSCLHPVCRLFVPQQFKQLQDQMRRQEQAQRQDDAPLREKTQLKQRLERRAKELKQQATGEHDKVLGTGNNQGYHELLDALVEDIRGVVSELSELEGQAAAREGAMAKLQEEIEALEARAAALPAEDDPALVARRQELLREQQDLNNQQAGYRDAMEEARMEAERAEAEARRVEGRLRQLDDAKTNRLQTLERRTTGITLAYRWVEANKSRFRGQVFGPIAVHVDCRNPQHAAFLEQHVPANMWSMFVVEHPEDQDLLLREIKQNFNFRPAISCYCGRADEGTRYPSGTAQEYGRFFITHTLDQAGPSRVCSLPVFDAPPLVKSVLNDECNLANAFVGTQQTPLQRLFDECPRVRLLWTPDGQCRKQQSSYNRDAISFMTQDLRPARLLVQGAGGPTDERGQLATQLAAAQRAASAARGEMEAAEEGRSHLRRSAEAKAREVSEVTLLDKAHRNAKDMAAAYVRSGEFFASLAAAELGAREAAAQAKALDDARRAHESTRAALERQLERYRAGLQRQKDGARKKKEEAEAATGQLTDEMQRAEADGLVISNPGALEAYERRLQEIRRLDDEAEELKTQLEERRARIDEVKGQWLPELRRTVAQINATFSTNFVRVGCAGEVALREVEGEDFANYAIEIQVKFREAEELQTLDANRQSGGERSVSTILYLISLQARLPCGCDWCGVWGVTVTPFRVVDEINQGMDPTNERKVFMQLVDAACRPGTPQCFLLTPKLLPGLSFTRDVRILQIMNGPYIKPVATRFSQDLLLGSQHRGQLAASQQAASQELLAV